MSVRAALFVLALLFFGVMPSLQADDSLLSPGWDQPATICQFGNQQLQIPDFTEPACREAMLAEVNPQNTALWVKTVFEKPENWHTLSAPFGLYIQGKVASEIYLNGQRLGQNGVPAFDKTEVPGAMDSVFYIPEYLIDEKHNELVVFMSGMHSVVDLRYPIHVLAFGQFGDPKRFIQRHSLLAMILLGIFVLGAFYFLALSMGHSASREYRLFAAMCLVAGLQLAAESSRGILSYPYPWHDIRLLSVTGLSFFFGVLILMHSSMLFATKRAVHWIYSGVILSLVAVIFAPGFDAKTTLGILVPCMLLSLQLAYNWFVTREKDILRWFKAYLLVSATVFWAAASFHEIVHFAIIAIFLGYLFVQQARHLRKQEQQLKDEQATVAKLEFKLAQNTSDTNASKLRITIAGRTELINSNHIAFCKAAGDYVELHLKNEDEKLYSGSLKQLEALLPPTFLKVHRSYLVNLNEVSSLSLKKDDEGRGHVLLLSTEHEVPVSRRLVATVRGSI